MPSEKAKDSRGFQSPSRYVQGPDEIKKLPKTAKNDGSTALYYRHLLLPALQR